MLLSRWRIQIVCLVLPVFTRILEVRDNELLGVVVKTYSLVGDPEMGKACHEQRGDTREQLIQCHFEMRISHWTTCLYGRRRGLQRFVLNDSPNDIAKLQGFNQELNGWIYDLTSYVNITVDISRCLS